MRAASMWTIAAITLAQSRTPYRRAGSGRFDAADIILWVGILILAVVALGIVILVVRRRTFPQAMPGAEAGMFEELRALRQRGEISREEYEAARARVVARLKGEASERSAPVSGLYLDPPRVEGELRARPGVDLTGRPLPKPGPAAAPRRPADPGRQ